MKNWKKHVIYFDHSTNTIVADEFAYAVRICIKWGIKFTAMHDRKKGRLEVECDDLLWNKLTRTCVYSSYD